MTNDVDFYTVGNPAPLTLDLPYYVAQFKNVVITNPFTELIDIHQNENRLYIIFDLKIELPQFPPIDIRRKERIAVGFATDVNQTPWIYSLRKDFPVDTLHQNLVPPDTPRSLCLFDEDYFDIKSKVTPVELLRRISHWLARAAIEELHDTDQPLEPLLITDNMILFDEGIFDEDFRDTTYLVELLNKNPILLRTRLVGNEHEKSLPNKLKSQNSFLLLPIVAPPWQARMIHYSPQNLADLVRLLADINFDLIDYLRKYVLDIKNNGDWERSKDLELILLLSLPKTSIKRSDVEIEWWSFLLNSVMRTIAVNLGLFAEHDGKLGVLLPPSEPIDLDRIPVLPLKPISRLNQSYANSLSNYNGDFNPKIAVVGAGALGSQTVLNLAKQGIGDWVIIDHDYLLPHNLARHGLSAIYEGWNKAIALSQEIALLLNDINLVHPYPNKFSQILIRENPELANHLEDSDLIFDFSASHGVSRELSYISENTHHLSAFIAPTGEDLIVLATGTQNGINLNDLEVQLAVAVTKDPSLKHIYSNAENIVPYAGSCRDTSISIPQDNVAIFSSVLSQYIKSSLLPINPFIGIWQWSSQELSMNLTNIHFSDVHVVYCSEWAIRVSYQAIELMKKNRLICLPNETGGVLIGQFDIERQIIYVGTMLSSPQDSVEKPDMFIRGHKELAQAIQEIQVLTQGDLTYIGEWHSHPTGTSSKPSEIDLAAFEELKKEIKSEGLPFLAIIQGDHEFPYIHIDVTI